MNELQIFANEQFGSVRIIEEDGKVLFCGADVAKALGYARPSEAVAKHAKGTLKRRILTNGGEQEMSFIPEGDVYRLIVSSKLPKAQEFEVWLFEIVLPAIRKHGGYIAGEEHMDDDELLAQAVLVAQRKLEERTAQLEAANRQIEADRPKVVFADAVSASEGAILVRDMAKILKQNGADEVGGEKKLFAWLREHGYLTLTNQPMQRYLNQGLFEVTEGTSQKPGCAPFVYFTTRITGKGQQYFVNLFIKGKEENV